MDGLQAGQILKQEGMNAELLEVGEKTLVVSKPTGFNLHAPNVLITIEGAFQTGIAKGIVRMLNETQCSECGKFNGLHGEVFIKTGQDGGGEVHGHYSPCSHAKS